MSGAIRLDPTGYIPLMPFSRPAGINLPVFTSYECWEEVIRHDPVGAMNALGSAIDRALIGGRADQSTITFKHWIPPQGNQRKAKRTRLSASLYQTIETEEPWILLRPNSRRSPHGLSLAS